MHALHLPDIRIESDRIDPPKHNPQVRHHEHHPLTQKRERRRYRPPHNPLKHRAHLLERQLITRKVDSNIPIPRIIRMDESLRGKVPDIRRADQLDLMALTQRRPQHRHERLAHEVRSEVLHEADGAQDGIAHLCAMVGLRLEVFLDIVLADEVRDVGGVGIALGAVPLDGGVDEVRDVVGERGVDEGFALLLFGLGRGAAAEGELDAEDAPDGGGGLGEDGGAVVEVAFDELDVGGFLGKGGGGCGGGVAGEGQDGGVFCVGSCEESVDDSAALLAGGAGDEECF